VPIVAGERGGEPDSLNHEDREVDPMEAAGIIVLAALAGLVVLGQIARRRLARRYRPTGRLVDVGGYRLHIDVQGTGPTVVLEGGTWVPGISWKPIQTELAGFARVVTYDRAGLGWSDSSPKPRTADVMAEELRELLERANIPAPYILVGHSFGGTIVRVLSHLHPELVAAVVLLDGAHEDQFVRAPESIRRFTARTAKAMPIIFAALGLLARAGLLALRPSLVPLTAKLPADVVATVQAQVASDPKVLAAMTAEMARLEAGNDRVRALAIRSLGDIPLRVVSHGRAEETPPGLDPDVAAEYERLWQELQAAQADLSTDSVRTIADAIGHDIPAEAPALVVDTVRPLAATAMRAGSASIGTSVGTPVATS
jgi:pimeloyl-ACP methyl ester carboxylesterase